MVGKANCRFFNEELRDVYDACILPSENDFIASNAHCVSKFSKQTQHICKWSHSAHIPDPGLSYPPGGAYFLSTPFRDFKPGSSPSLKSNRSNKRQRTLDGPLQQTDVLVDEPRRKKTNGQLRKEEMQDHFRVLKIRMLPTKDQRRELKRCCYVARRAYNWANECVREGFMEPNHFKLRKKWNDQKIMDTLNEEGKQPVAGRIISHAIKQLTDAYQSNFARKKKDPSHRFSVRFRSLRKTYTEALVIDKDTLKPDGVSYSKNSPFTCFKASDSPVLRGRSECLAFFGSNLKATGGIRLQDKTHVIARLVADGNYLKEEAKILWDKRTDSFYFAYLFALPRLEDPNPEFDRKRIVATDPGNSPFQQWYSPTSGSYGQLLEDARPELKAKCLRLDSLQARIDRRYQQPQACLTSRREDNGDPKRQRNQRYRTTRRLRRKLARDRRRVHGYIESAHYDAANFILARFDIVIQPVLSVSRLCKRSGRGFCSRTARAMYTWSHYLFRQRLKSAAARYPGRHIYETTEPGTSKTCTHCGFWNASLRLGDKRFDCPRCCLQVDRQIAGARNNFLAAYGMAVGVGWGGVGG